MKFLCVAFALYFALLSYAYDVEVIDKVENWNLEQPKFNLTDVQPEDRSYEIRRYEAAKWVTTIVVAFNEDKAKKTGYMRLFHYIRGANNRGIQIAMTAPVVTGVESNRCVFCPFNYSVSFYISPAHQADPPKPTSPDVYIDATPATTFYVRYFDGYARRDRSKIAAYQLAEALRRNNVTASAYNSRVMFIAEYDNPWKWWNRHNEIWFFHSFGDRTQRDDAL